MDRRTWLGTTIGGLLATRLPWKSRKADRPQGPIKVEQSVGGSTLTTCSLPIPPQCGSLLVLCTTDWNQLGSTGWTLAQEREGLAVLYKRVESDGDGVVQFARPVRASLTEFSGAQMG